MLDLNFQVQGAEAVPFAAVPQLALKLHIANASAAEQIQSVLLNCQIQLEVTLRHYAVTEQQRLTELFGASERWAQTLKAMHWTTVSFNVPRFEGSIEVDLLVPCSFDFNVAATKYFAGLDAGEIPLCLLFSGTVFYRDENSALQITQIPWDKEAKYRLPVKVWREMMDIYYPNSVWLSLNRELFDRLHEHKRLGAFLTWEQALENLLAKESVSEHETVAELSN